MTERQLKEAACPTCLYLCQVSLCLPNAEEGDDGETAEGGALSHMSLPVPRVSTCLRCL